MATDSYGSAQASDGRSTTLTVLEPSSVPESAVLESNLALLRQAGFQVSYQRYPPDAGDRRARAGVSARGQTLLSALSDPECAYVLAARGGYGASDLLRYLDWSALSLLPETILVGFSDISALQIALYSRLGWPSIHGPMPGSALWTNGADIDCLLRLLSSSRPWSSTISVSLLGGDSTNTTVQGTLIGGCLSVLSALIGTSYFPPTLQGHILFLEDTNETAERVLRFWNQWLDADLVAGLSAVVVGRFTELSGGHDEEWLVARFAERCTVPLFRSPDFGHVSPNQPLMIGADARIKDGILEWWLD
ncbi:MAG: LD-carboxypeptidase [Gammaproteobacteria bacterium]|nr:LD-carboxypeptidase [Gammaproteobacteria bacterium]